MNIVPLSNRIIIKRSVEEELVKGGIIIPDMAKEKKNEGIVLAVGSGKIDNNGNRIPMDIQVNDNVIFNEYVGIDIKYDNEDYIILTQDDVLCVIG